MKGGKGRERGTYIEEGESDFPRVKDIVFVSGEIAHALKLLVPINDGSATAVDNDVGLAGEVSGGGVQEERTEG